MAKIQQPRKNVPRAIKTVWIRLVLCECLLGLSYNWLFPDLVLWYSLRLQRFYRKSSHLNSWAWHQSNNCLKIGLLVSPSDPSLNLASTAAKSPFVIAIKVSIHSWTWILAAKFLTINNIERRNIRPAIYYQRGSSHECLVLWLRRSLRVVSHSVRSRSSWPRSKDIPQD